MHSPRLLFTFAASLSLASACTWGDRALDGCPEDEVCSDQTPSGLSFRAQPLADVLGQQIRPIAVGGTLSISLIDLRTGEELTAPWTPKLTRDGFEITDQLRNTLRLRATAPSRAFLRIVDGRNDELYDRHAIEAIAMTRATIVPAREVMSDPGRPQAWIAGSPIDIAAKLYGDVSGGEERLVDDSLRLQLVNAGGAVLDQHSWDHFTVRNAAVGGFALSLSAGAARDLSIPITVVDGIDSIVAGKTEGPVTAGEGTVVCFEARRGETAVVGLDWTFKVEPAVDNSPSFLSSNCVFLMPKVQGKITVTGSARDHSTSLVVDVLPPKPTVRAAALPEQPELEGSLGERARSLQ